MGWGGNWWRGVGAAVAVCSVVLTGGGPVSASGGLDEAAVEKVVRGYAGKAGYPGVAVAITNGDQTLYAGGYGRDSAGEAVTEATLMPIASVSKSFTALAVMQLVEAGKVTLDAPVRDYLADFRIGDARGARITVRELLSQTSGITDNTLAEKSLPQPGSLAGAVTRARGATLAVLVDGGGPSSGAPVRLVVDLVLGALTLLSVFLGVRNLRRSRAWAVRFRRAPVWRLVLRLLPRLVPLALLVALPDLIGMLFGGGRDVTFVQLCYYSIALIAWTSIAAVLNIGVLATRVALLVRLRRPAGNAPEPSIPAQALTG